MFSGSVRDGISRISKGGVSFGGGWCELLMVVVGAECRGGCSSIDHKCVMCKYMIVKISAMDLWRRSVHTQRDQRS